MSFSQMINFCGEKRTFSIRPNHVTHSSSREKIVKLSLLEDARPEKGRGGLFPPPRRPGLGYDVSVSVSVMCVVHIGIHSRIVPRWRENDVAPALAQGGCKHSGVVDDPAVSTRGRRERAMAKSVLSSDSLPKAGRVNEGEKEISFFVPSEGDAPLLSRNCPFKQHSLCVLSLFSLLKKKKIKNGRTLSLFMLSSSCG